MVRATIGCWPSMIGSLELRPGSLRADEHSRDQGLYDGTEIAGSSTEPDGGRRSGASSYLTFVLGGNRGNRPDENDQGVIGELYENPNASSYAKGATFFDRQYVLKWATSYHAPHDILVAAAARYQDGQPFSRLLVVPDLAQGPES